MTVIADLRAVGSGGRFLSLVHNDEFREATCIPNKMSVLSKEISSYMSRQLAPKGTPPT